MIKNLSGRRIVWTKHAAKEVLEDNFNPALIEKCLDRIAKFPEFNENKNRGVTKLDGRYCTLIYVKMKLGLKVVTCWESSQNEIKEYRRAVRGYKNK
ncbi:MAG: hypothetical protein JW778_05780 [Candidatus Altiarchaeota archaeon]|nr:hypothetical protein [Candidatus Altiarchaeota archaeon]